MTPPILGLPVELIPAWVATRAPGVSISGTYYRVVKHGSALDLKLPRLPCKSLDKRGSVPLVNDALYLASTEATAMAETWSPKDRWKRDLYKVEVHVSGIFDLRGEGVLLGADCFRVALPPNPTDRNYAAWHYLAYAIWSAGFAGIVWRSLRFAGDVLCLYHLEGASSLGPSTLEKKGVRSSP